jgi:hypothetical protein
MSANIFWVGTGWAIAVLLQAYGEQIAKHAGVGVSCAGVLHSGHWHFV